MVLDDFSRFIVGGALWDGERVAAVMETFSDAVQRHGKPEKVMSDGGSAFYAWKGVGQFTRLLEEFEIDQLIAKTPQVNGKLEVLNTNVAKELFNQETFFDLGEASRRLAAIESGQRPDGLSEPLAVGQRELDLLRLTSCRGRLELSLLGHSIALPLSRCDSLCRLICLAKLNHDTP